MSKIAAYLDAEAKFKMAQEWFDYVPEHSTNCRTLIYKPDVRNNGEHSIPPSLQGFLVQAIKNDLERLLKEALNLQSLDKIRLGKEACVEYENMLRDAGILEVENND